MVSAEDRFPLSSRRGRRGPGTGGFFIGIAPLSGSPPARSSRERDELFVASHRLFRFGQGNKVHSPIPLFPLNRSAGLRPGANHSCPCLSSPVARPALHASPQFVGVMASSFRFSACLATMNLAQVRRHRPGAAGILPAVLFSDCSAGKMPAALCGSW